MLFNSYPFILLFLPITLAGFFAVARVSRRLAGLWLALAALFFYGWWNPVYVGLLLASIAGNFAIGSVIGHRRAHAGASRRPFLLAAAIAANLLLLGYFKYANFFVSTVDGLAGAGWTLPNVVLPLGISFFTFTQIAFLVDVARGIAREFDFLNYLLFVSYFPHLIAGPVIHHKQVMPQFDLAATYRFDSANVGLGLTIFAVGLFKKVMVADQLALYANPIFRTVAAGSEPRLMEAWVGALAYTLQLYFDFSGYSDMAVGLSKMFNVDIPINFNSPYKATNIIDFWRRWHMTLSAFLRDYLYIPLGGNRRGSTRRYLNIMITMLLGGLWHGANWTFVLWGGLHGLFLLVNHGWREARRHVALPRLPGAQWLARLLTFGSVVVGWVLFRADSFAAARRMLAGMAGANGISLPARFASRLAHPPVRGIAFDGWLPLSGLAPHDIAPWLVLGLAIVWMLPNVYEWTAQRHAVASSVHGALAWHARPRFAVVVALMLAVSMLGLRRASQFLYFQF
jgi:alginate O-acetyltransferase complex protein AlgI